MGCVVRAWYAVWQGSARAPCMAQRVWGHDGACRGKGHGCMMGYRDVGVHGYDEDMGAREYGGMGAWVGACACGMLAWHTSVFVRCSKPCSSKSCHDGAWGHNRGMMGTEA